MFTNRFEGILTSTSIPEAALRSVGEHVRSAGATWTLGIILSKEGDEASTTIALRLEGGELLVEADVAHEAQVIISSHVAISSSRAGPELMKETDAFLLSFESEAIKRLQAIVDNLVSQES